MLTRRRFLASTALSPLGVHALPVSAKESTPEPSRLICPTISERDGAVVIDGAGTRLSEPFTLAKGRYRIEMEFTFAGDPSHVAVRLHTPDGGYELVYTASEGEAFASALVRVRASGECLVEVTGDTTAWRVALSPV